MCDDEGDKDVICVWDTFKARKVPRDIDERKQSISSICLDKRETVRYR